MVCFAYNAPQLIPSILHSRYRIYFIMQFQKTLITIAAALAFGAASTTLFATPITTEGVGVGKHGDIRVAVTFDNGKIQKIDILKNAENPVLSKKVFISAAISFTQFIIPAFTTYPDMISSLGSPDIPSIPTTLRASLR